jgi:hypothetical protein
LALVAASLPRLFSSPMCWFSMVLLSLCSAISRSRQLRRHCTAPLIPPPDITPLPTHPSTPHRATYGAVLSCNELFPLSAHYEVKGRDGVRALRWQRRREMDLLSHAALSRYLAPSIVCADTTLSSPPSTILES